MSLSLPPRRPRLRSSLRTLRTRKEPGCGVCGWHSSQCSASDPCRRRVGRRVDGNQCVHAGVLAGPPPDAAVASTEGQSTNPMVLLFGRNKIGSSVRPTAAGRAEAFRFVEQQGGAARAISIYVTAPSTSKTLLAGLYTDGGSSPLSLLASGSSSVSKNGQSVTVAIKRTALTQGGAYWIAVLGKRGTLATRARPGASCQGVTERTARLAALPQQWKAGTSLKECISAYVRGLQIIKGPIAITNPGDTSGTGGSSTGGASPTGGTAPVNTSTPLDFGGAGDQRQRPAGADTHRVQRLVGRTARSSYAYQWQDCSSSTSCTDISGATSSSYTLRPRTLARRSTWSSPRPTPAAPPATSAQTGTVQPLAPVNTAAPVISGSAQQGHAQCVEWFVVEQPELVSVSVAGLLLLYQLREYLRRDQLDLYARVLGRRQDGRRRRHRAQCRRCRFGDLGPDGHRAGRVTPAPVNTAAPAISGSAQQGDTLRCLEWFVV